MDAAYEATEAKFDRARLLELGAAKMLQDGCSRSELRLVHEALGESIQIRHDAERIRDEIKKEYQDAPAKRKRVAK